MVILSLLDLARANLSQRNAPFALGMRAAATTIATGNTTVIKGSELSPRCYWALGQVFQDAGLPPGVLNIIYCNASNSTAVTNAIIRHLAVKKVNFTGSIEVGKMIARTCGENLKPCLMELGGKNSAIVLADADLQKAAHECFVGSVFHVCIPPRLQNFEAHLLTLEIYDSRDKSVCLQIVL